MRSNLKLIGVSAICAVGLVGCNAEKSSNTEGASEEAVVSSELSQENQALFDKMLPAFHVTKVGVACVENYSDDLELEEIFVAYDTRNKAQVTATIKSAQETGEFIDEVRAKFAEDAQLLADASLQTEIPTSQACWSFANKVKSGEFDLPGVEVPSLEAAE